MGQKAESLLMRGLKHQHKSFLADLSTFGVFRFVASKWLHPNKKAYHRESAGEKRKKIDFTT